MEHQLVFADRRDFVLLDLVANHDAALQTFFEHGPATATRFDCFGQGRFGATDDRRRRLARLVQ